MVDSLTEQNYIRYAMNHYDNPQCKGVSEFEEDMARLIYLKRLFRKYRKTGVLRERLILNHMIVFCNVMGLEAGVRLLFFRIDPDLHYILRTFLVYLGYLPEGQPKFKLEVDVVPIVLDMKIIDRLRSI
jgi:nitroreductase